MFDYDHIAKSEIAIDKGTLKATVTLHLDRDEVAFYCEQMPLSDGERNHWYKLLMRFDAINSIADSDKYGIADYNAGEFYK